MRHECEHSGVELDELLFQLIMPVVRDQQVAFLNLAPCGIVRDGLEASNDGRVLLLIVQGRLDSFNDQKRDVAC